MATRQMLIGTVFEAFAHTKSIDFDGGTERMLNSTSQTYGLVDEWTIMCWFKINPLVNAGSQRVFVDMTEAAFDSSNRVNFQIRTNDQFRLSIANSGGSFFLAGNYAAVNVPDDQWVQATVTYDGSLSGTARVVSYFDSVVKTGTFDFNSAGNQTDGNRIIQLGGFLDGGLAWGGRLHSVAMWNTVLDSGNAAAIYNAGDADSFDLKKDTGGYTNSDNLKHWWQLGTAGDIGIDVVGGSSFDIAANATDITEGDDAVSDSPGANAQYISLDFDGTFEGMFNTTSQAIGVANAWTFSQWVKSDVSDEQVLWNIRPPSAGNESRILGSKLSTNALRVFWSDTSASPAVEADWNSFFTNDVWHHIAVTWNGTTLVVYRDGVDQGAPDVGSATPSLTMADDNRTVTLCAAQNQAASVSLQGPCSQVALWRVALSSAAITDIYNGGAPNQLDLTKNFGANYSSAADLAHWWRLGHEDSPDLGKDFATAGFTPTIDVETDAVGITDADRVSDVP